MISRRLARIVLLAIMLSSCATDRGEKPILTAGILKRVAATCGASGARLHHQRGAALPNVFFKIHDEAQGDSEKPTPTVTCMDTGLKPYRYQFTGFKGDHSITAD